MENTFWAAVKEENFVATQTVENSRMYNFTLTKENTINTNKSLDFLVDFIETWNGGKAILCRAQLKDPGELVSSILLDGYVNVDVIIDMMLELTSILKVKNNG